MVKIQRQTTNSLLGRKIKRLRHERGITQADLAEKADVSLKHLGEIERGRGNPTLKSLDNLSKSLGVALSDLFDFEGEKSEDVLRKEVAARLNSADQSVLRLLHRALKP